MEYIISFSGWQDECIDTTTTQELQIGDTAIFDNEDCGKDGHRFRVEGIVYKREIFLNHEGEQCMFFKCHITDYYDDKKD